MVLDSMIRAAKTRPVRRVQDMALESIKYAQNPNRGMIIGDEKPRAVTQAVQPVVQNGNSAAVPTASYHESHSRGTSITGIAHEMSSAKAYAHSAGADVSWQNCKCKVAAGTDRYLCRKFNIVCVKEKCPAKFIEV